MRAADHDLMKTIYVSKRFAKIPSPLLDAGTDLVPSLVLNYNNTVSYLSCHDQSCQFFQYLNTYDTYMPLTLFYISAKTSMYRILFVLYVTMYCKSMYVCIYKYNTIPQARGMYKCVDNKTSLTYTQYNYSTSREVLKLSLIFTLLVCPKATARAVARSKLS